jgi:hypothetical protein
MPDDEMERYWELKDAITAALADQEAPRITGRRPTPQEAMYWGDIFKHFMQHWFTDRYARTAVRSEDSTEDIVRGAVEAYKAYLTETVTVTWTIPAWLPDVLEYGILHNLSAGEHPNLRTHDYGTTAARQAVRAVIAAEKRRHQLAQRRRDRWINETQVTSAETQPEGM